jgi:hypothetical protein
MPMFPWRLATGVRLSHPFVVPLSSLISRTQRSASLLDYPAQPIATQLPVHAAQ